MFCSGGEEKVEGETFRVIRGSFRIPSSKNNGRMICSMVMGGLGNKKECIKFELDPII